VAEAQRLKQLEDENCRLKLLVAELGLHGEALKGVIRKTAEACRSKRLWRTSCWAWSGRVIGMSRGPIATWSCETSGCSWRGHAVNVKRVYRLYLEEA